MFTIELANRLAGHAITVNAADPGFVRTNLGRHASGAFKLLLTLTRPFQTPAAKAAATPAWIVTAPVATTGGYYRRCRPATTSDLARDPVVARALWRDTATLLVDRGLATPAELAAIPDPQTTTGQYVVGPGPETEPSP